ncbi:DNA cytosine methyltransferase [Mixta calida]|uniref:DNA cytosine methyltransferase n=1 Tax=Mixta calida TaxID=665913 RepID=UPI000CDDBDD9|nr:DNA cytosine methyltransferase [Mixta calida]POU43929.1 DNA cytosine methyltransferase [Pantoea sp. PSNIH5]POU59235.1 DNA cytosine methyltransferase [Pantoea sp. PSNIH4]POY65746.1 DNA cytosine methyltransferase [Pantoea sp. PSNIH3]
MTAYYNEIEPYAAQWLRNLIEAGHIAPGVVDERSIEDVTPGDLRGFTQCHFFAGIGVWSYALRHAGWRDDRPVWTGSSPCQPFSAAGKGSGFADERHLWPHFHYLIEKCRPETVFGEQVASKDGLDWFDLVQTDLEGTGYTSAAVDLCAAGFGAPHIRQRLFWVANADSEQRNGRRDERQAGWNEPAIRSPASGLADASGERCHRFNPLLQREASGRVTESLPEAAGYSEIGGMGHSNNPRLERYGRDDGAAGRKGSARPTSAASLHGSANPTNGFWRDADWLFCRDGKWRPVEPGSFPLVNGATQRVGRLRAYGNAINAEVAKGFIEAYMETQHDAA